MRERNTASPRRAKARNTKTIGVDHQQYALKSQAAIYTTHLGWRMDGRAEKAEELMVDVVWQEQFGGCGGGLSELGLFFVDTSLLVTPVEKDTKPSVGIVLYFSLFSTWRLVCLFCKSTILHLHLVK
jgi:hypothetical protein